MGRTEVTMTCLYAGPCYRDPQGPRGCSLSWAKRSFSDDDEAGHYRGQRSTTACSLKGGLFGVLHCGRILIDLAPFSDLLCAGTTADRVLNQDSVETNARMDGLIAV
ncbi:unnamed protein product [Mesocestoides corti]|uniref:Uncharacterized protein n=1 Tax=Mesocestoides corti TaxID=53468 RepID=A0A0R3U2N3_MESCO|nr:unnamed protein product [Mesocestoides corti]